MASAAAASSAQRRREQKARHYASVQKARRLRSERADAAFDKLSSNGKTLAESHVHDFLSAVVQIPREDLSPDAVQLVIDTAYRYQRQQSQEQQSENGLLKRQALLAAAGKYGEYVRQSKAINAIYDTFDRDHDDLLSRRELLRALQDRERKTPRHVQGIVVRLVVTEEDIDFVLEKCDADGDGKISRSELLPALAAWEELAAVKLEDESACCTLL